jgi:D-glycerate 3-kinase
LNSKFSPPLPDPVHAGLNIQLESILSADILDRDRLQYLADQLLADRRRATAFHITPANVNAIAQQQIQWLRSLHPQLTLLSPTPDFLPTGWTLWLPLAQHLIRLRHTQNRPIIQGILGGQGTGKTTLGKLLTAILTHLGYKTLSLSLDDLYKTQRDRLQLRSQDPRLIWRGPPGTHDVDLGLQVLDSLRSATSETVPIPRFDKSLWDGAGDRIDPEPVTGIDIVLFEGWFVGARPLVGYDWNTAPPPIVTEGDRAFAQDCNQRLQDYLPLWQRLDSLMVLHPTDYRWSKQWRQQAEHDLQKAGRSGMSDAAIETFVDYFWQALHPELFITPLVQQAGIAELIVEIDQNHAPGAVYSPDFSLQP